MQLQCEVLLVFTEALLIFDGVVADVCLAQLMYFFQHVVALVPLRQHVMLKFFFHFTALLDLIQLLERLILLVHFTRIDGLHVLCFLAPNEMQFVLNKVLVHFLALLGPLFLLKHELSALKFMGFLYAAVTLVAHQRL